MRKLASFTVLVAIACAAPALGQTRDPEQCAIEGRAAFDRGDPRKASELFRNAAVGFRAAGRLDDAAHAAWEVVVATDPRHDSTRTWPELARSVDVALRFVRAANDLKLEALLLLQKSDALRPDLGAGGTWEEAITLADEALAVSTRAGDPKNELTTLLTVSEIHMPLPGRSGGSWERAFTLHTRAAELAKELGEVPARARHVMFMATCVLPGNHPQGSLANARKLYEAGEALHSQAKQAEQAATAALLLAVTFLPERDPQADAAGFATARAAFGRAIRGLAAAGRRRLLGRALVGLAICSEPGRDPAGSWAASGELYRLAAEQLEAAGLADECANARQLSARCLERGAGPRASAGPAIPATRR